jgi:hypothetical protein
MDLRLSAEELSVLGRLYKAADGYGDRFPIYPKEPASGLADIPAAQLIKALSYLCELGLAGMEIERHNHEGKAHYQLSEVFITGAGAKLVRESGSAAD